MTWRQIEQDSRSARKIPGRWGSRCNSCIENSYPEICLTVVMDKRPFFKGVSGLLVRVRLSAKLSVFWALRILENAAGIGGHREVNPLAKQRQLETFLSLKNSLFL